PRRRARRPTARPPAPDLRRTGRTVVEVDIVMWIAWGALLMPGTRVSAQQAPGSLRGVVRDKDLGSPLAGAEVRIVETGQKAATEDQGAFVFASVPPGTYTLAFSKDGYLRQVKAEVVVSSGQLTDLEVSLAAEVTEMEEFVVQDVLRLAAGTEAAL